MRRPTLVTLLILLGGLQDPGRPARAATPLTTVRVASGLVRPVFVTSAPGDTSRLFIVEQRGLDGRGRIKILKNGILSPAPFLTTDVLSTGFEQGLLGLAFAPDYATSGRFYINYTNASGRTVIARHTVSADPDVANPAGTQILSFHQPFANHNGGWMGFGPDGLLYIATGDGGSAGDPGDRAQNPDSLLGKILRIDVSGSGYLIPPGNPFAGPAPGADEIWMTGLRNPWRPSFDRETGDLIIADVGQSLREEINFVPAGAGAGLNLGWRCYEGSQFYTESATIPCGSCLAAGCPKGFPAHEYGHAAGRCSVTGGYVYRGCAVPDLRGTYFYADWCTGEIITGRFSGGALVDSINRTAELAPGGGLSIGSITSFGEDGRGELYICDGDGEVYKTVPAAPVLEADMPIVRAEVATGDTLGATTPGNALAPGATPFAGPGSRLRAVGYLSDALLLPCAAVAGGCLTAALRLAPYDINVESCVDSVSSTLTRRFIFTSTDPSPQPLAYIDVIDPLLNGDDDRAATSEAGSPGKSASLVLYESVGPDRWIVHEGTTRTGVTMSADVDSAQLVTARIAADQPLGGGTAAGPAPIALALGFDFGTVSTASPETVTVATRIELSPPVGLEDAPQPRPRGPRLTVGPVPFTTDLRVVVQSERHRPARVEVFDASGRLVRRVARTTLSPGTTLLRWDGLTGGGRRAAPGVYFVRLVTPDFEETRRAVRVR